MAKANEYAIKQRILKVLLAILESPKIYTSDRLSEMYGCSRSTINRDIIALRDAGFIVKSDDRHRYYFEVEKPFKQLKELLLFSAEDQELLYQAIGKIDITDRRGQQLKRKLAAIYDYKKLGHAYLRKPYLTRIDNLQIGRDEKRCVILKNYRSSSHIADRLLEAYHISPPDDTLQAYNRDENKVKHYRISRAIKIILTDMPWEHEGKHNIQRTDPFRIVNNQQQMVHLRMGVGAYNELIERFPLTKAYLQESEEEEEVYDFQCMVNEKFIGITNFILGFYHQRIEVISPDRLRDHLQAQIEKMNFF
ncbi:MAG: WYL domain-containing protein [Bacteroidota bacterium]